MLDRDKNYILNLFKNSIIIENKTTRIFKEDYSPYGLTSS